MNRIKKPNDFSRRSFLTGTATAVATISVRSTKGLSSIGDGRKPTVFQHACMTLPYSNFSFERALSGIQAAGFRYVAWGVRHREANGEQVPVISEDASPLTAQLLGRRCRDLGLEPVLMFSTIYPEHANGLAVLTHRIKQASAAEIGQVLTFGHTQGGNRAIWIERLRLLGPIARDHGVMLVVKQHGGTTGTGEACAEIIREVNDPNVFVNYDAGNVMDYLDVDPIPDVRKCAAEIRSFCVKDHRNWPKDQDCGPGFGEIDHYRLFEPVAFSGLTMPLAYENISAPLVSPPTTPEGVDQLARRAREFLEAVISGLQQPAA